MVHHAQTPADTLAKYGEALKQIGAFYTEGLKDEKGAPYELHVAWQVLNHGVFGTSREKEIQVGWIQSLCKRQAVVIRKMIRTRNDQIRPEALEALAAKWNVEDMRPAHEVKEGDVVCLCGFTAKSTAGLKRHKAGGKCPHKVTDR
jgi:hypothetical protein